MTAKTKAQLYAEIDANYPDNTSGLITPAIQRTTDKDEVDSFQQAPAVNVQIGSAYTFTVDDFGKLVLFNSAVPVGVTLPQAVGAFINWNVMVANIGVGAVTITPTVSTIGGAASITLLQRQCQTIVSDGANYQLGQNTAVGVSGSGNFPVFNDTINGLVIRPIVSTDLPACQFAAIGAVKAKVDVPNQWLKSLDEGGAFISARPTVSDIGPNGVREKLIANRSYRVRSTPVAITIPVASPGVVNWTAHGLVTNQEVYFSLPLNFTTPVSGVAISNASPAVVTWPGGANHNLLPGTPIRFSTTGALPAPLSIGLIYYVRATGITATTFQISTIPEGMTGSTVVNTGSAGSGTHSVLVIGVSISVATPAVVTWPGHNMVANQPVVFNVAGGTLPTGVTAGTKYYVRSIGLNPNDFQISATAGGAAINTTGTSTGPQFGQMAGTLPTGFTEGTPYFVIGASITANSFQVSTVAGSGTPVNATGTSEGQFWGQFGSDSFDGLTTLTPFASIQKAIDVASGTIDMGPFFCAINVALGTYTQSLTLRSYVGAGPIQISGPSAQQTPVISVTNASCFVADGCQRYALNFFKVTNAGSPLSSISVLRNAILDVQSFDFGVSQNTHLSATSQGLVNVFGPCTVSGGAINHMASAQNASLADVGKIYTLIGVPVFTQQWYSCIQSAVIVANSNTYIGTAIGGRAASNTNAVIDTIGAAATSLPGNSGPTVDGALVTVVPQAGAAGGVYS